MRKLQTCRKSLTKITTTYGVGNLGHSLEQTEKSGGVKLVNGMPTLCLHPIM
jgi:hypothetical protein